jgi:hypothetical protein
LEPEIAGAGELTARQPGVGTVGVAEGVLDRKPHVGGRELGRRSNNQRASRISNPLFKRVAESTVIRRPMFQVG